MTVQGHTSIQEPLLGAVQLIVQGLSSDIHHCGTWQLLSRGCHRSICADFQNHCLLVLDGTARRTSYQGWRAMLSNRVLVISLRGSVVLATSGINRARAGQRSVHRAC